MPERQQEERHLAQANRHIAESEERIRVWQQRLGVKRKQGEAAEISQVLLSTMMDGLDAMKVHREQILARLADLDKFPATENPPLPNNSFP